ncbi:hypothetical protein HCG49_16630 [Arenibacter sp. 6A1]|nr:hypothetical protein [Arenibacter sp. 6A1]
MENFHVLAEGWPHNPFAATRTPDIDQDLFKEALFPWGHHLQNRATRPSLFPPASTTKPLSLFFFRNLI